MSSFSLLQTKVGPIDELPAEVSDMSTPSMKNSKTEEAQSTGFSDLPFDEVNREDEERDSVPHLPTKQISSLAIRIKGKTSFPIDDSLEIIKRRRREVVPIGDSDSSITFESLIELCSAHAGRDSLETPSHESPKYSQSSWSPQEGVLTFWKNGVYKKGNFIQDLPINLLSIIATKYKGLNSSLLYQSLLLQEFRMPKPHYERVPATLVLCSAKKKRLMKKHPDQVTIQRLFRVSCEDFQIEGFKITKVKSKFSFLNKLIDAFRCTSQSEQKKSRLRFKSPWCLKLRSKKRTNDLCVQTEDQTADTRIPDDVQSPSVEATSTPNKTTSKTRRKSVFSRLAYAFSRICGRRGKSPT
ncbi:uncharacterized protein LOC143495153 isoform X1 [Brachyhypopomus gauderio]|uniref:uncharacterized protein LOC143495153 isoform X1 n=1 Tax=Brachyhypopomus gauderio TaxID=698409 RepID=UPI0040418066